MSSYTLNCTASWKIFCSLFGVQYLDGYTDVKQFNFFLKSFKVLFSSSYTFCICPDFKNKLHGLRSWDHAEKRTSFSLKGLLTCNWKNFVYTVSNTFLRYAQTWAIIWGTKIGWKCYCFKPKHFVLLNYPSQIKTPINPHFPTAALCWSLGFSS